MRRVSLLRHLAVSLILAVVVSTLGFPVAGTTAAGAAAAKLDPELLKLLSGGDSGSVDVLIIAKPMPPSRFEGLSRQGKLGLLKSWAGRTLEPVIDAVKSYGGTVYRTYWLVPAVSARIPVRSLTSVASIPQVEAIIWNKPSFHVDDQLAAGLAGDPRGGELNWGVEGVNATAAWRLGYKGLGVKVAVLDTGIDPDHPSLSGKLFTLLPGDPLYPGGWIEFDDNGVPQCTSPHDTSGHGTFVASEVAGNLVGVAPEAQLMAALVLPGGSGTPAQVLAGFEWAADPYLCNGSETHIYPNVVVFSAGWRGYTGSFLLDVIRELLELGVVVISSIGNYGPNSTTYPANIWGVIGAGAINESMKVAPFSGGGIVAWANPPSEWPFKPPYPSHYLKPDFTAPGVNVGGALPGNVYGTGNGTSFAAAHIAGVAALVIQALNATDFKSPLKGYTLPELVYDIIANTSVDLGPPGLDDRYGWGAVNAGEAVEYAVRLLEKFPVTLKVKPPKAHVGDVVSVEISPVEGQVQPPDGAVFTVYFDDKPVATAVFHGGVASASFRVPEAPMGLHRLEAVSRAGFKGATDLYVEPSIRLVPQETRPYSTVEVVALGHPANATLAVLLDGEPASRVVTNSRGTGLTGLPVPEDETPGVHVVETVYNGTVIAEANLTIVARGALEVKAVAVPLNSSNAVIYILTLFQGEPVDANVSASLIGGAPKTLEPRRLARGVYEAIVKLPERPVLVVVSAVLKSEGVEAFGSDIAVVAPPQAPGQLLGMLQAINNTLAGELWVLESNSQALQTLLEAAANFSANLSQGIGSLERGQARLEEELDNIAATLEALNSSAALTLERLDYLKSLIEGSTRELEASIYSVNSTLHTTAAGLNASIQALKELMGAKLEAISVSLNKSSSAIQASIGAGESRLEAELEGLQANVSRGLAAAEESIKASIRGAAEMVSSQVKALHDAINELAGQEEELAARITSLEAGLKALLAKVDSIADYLHKSLEAINATLASLLNEVEQLASTKTGHQTSGTTPPSTKTSRTQATTTTMRGGEEQRSKGTETGLKVATAGALAIAVAAALLALRAYTRARP